MQKWLFLFVFIAYTLPYHGVQDFSILDEKNQRTCDAPCSPVHEYIAIPCKEASCIERAQKQDYEMCAPIQSPRDESTPCIPRQTPSVIPQQKVAHLIKQNTPHIQSIILSTQKRE